MRGMEKSEMQRIAADVEALKKLMILSLVQKGFKQKELASVLNVDGAILSKMFPKGLLKRAKGQTTPPDTSHGVGRNVCGRPTKSQKSKGIKEQTESSISIG